MKPSELKKGQIVAVNFPYSQDPEKKYGFRVEKAPYKAGGPIHFDHDHGPKDLLDPYFVEVTDVKTDERKRFAFPSFDEDVPNWTLLEEAPPFTQPPAKA